MYGCGDLIFSSHMTFILTFTLLFNKYASTKVLCDAFCSLMFETCCLDVWLPSFLFATSQVAKRVAWVLAVALAVLIISSRKHYSVDVVIAWYAPYDIA